MGSSPDPLPVAVALGSNIGDREQQLRNAVAKLASFLHNVRTSSFVDTEPVGVSPQPRFLNGVVVGETTLSAGDLLAALLRVEADLGRTRPFSGAPRTIDLDLILYASEVHATPALTVPHPRFRERAFVLVPLAELAGDWRDPISGHTVAELLAQLEVAGRASGDGG